MKAIIYDCEIIRAIPPRKGDRLNGIEYCEGWRAFATMGISVIGAYDYAEDRYRVFCEDNRDAFADLCAATDICVGFNSIPFDNALIAATPYWCVPPAEKCYDLLREIWEAAGLGQDFDGKTHVGFGIDAICEANFGIRKTGNGELAPVAWQLGKIGNVIDYCLNDVRLTKRLFDAVLRGQPLINPKDKSLLVLRNPCVDAEPA